MGMRKGVVVDLDETIKSIEAATEKAERMAGFHVSDVFVGITGDHIRSTNNRAVVAVSGDDREVSPVDVRRVIDASKIINLPGRPPDHSRAAALLHRGRPRRRRGSGRHGGRPPRSRHAHLITGGSTFITNVLKCVHRAGLEAAGLVFEPLASSASTLHGRRETSRRRAARHRRRYDRHRGVFARQRDLTSTIPVGGNILTNDISLGLKTSLAEAEEVKKRFGAGVRDATNEETFPVRTLDGRATKDATTTQLRQIVVPRVLETLRMAKTENRRERSARSRSRRSGPDGRRQPAAGNRTDRRRRLRFAGARRHADGRWAV